MSRPVVTIIGLGVVGGSYAGALTEAEYRRFDDYLKNVVMKGA